MSLTFDETEKLITEIDERLERLARIKVKAENIPVPVVRDKYGRLVSDYSLKLWLLKLHEEVLEFEYELGHCCNIDDLPKNLKELYDENKELIAGEACDIITVLYGICQAFGIDANFMGNMMYSTVEKNRGRGYMENGEK